MLAIAEVSMTRFPFVLTQRAICCCFRKACPVVFLILTHSYSGFSESSLDDRNGQKAEKVEDSKETPQTTKPPTPLSLQSLLKLPSGVTLEVEHRSRYETIANRFRLGETGGDQQYALRTRVRLEVAERLDPVRFLVELEDSRVYLTDPGSAVNSVQVDKYDFLQLHVGWVNHDLFRAGIGSALQFGRFSMDLGKRRLFARSRFPNATTRFDGIHWNLKANQSWKLQSFLFNPVVLRMTGLDRRDKHTLFWGTYLSARQQRSSKLDLYYFGLRTGPSAPNRQLNLTTVGLRWYRDAAKGKFDYEAESAWQFGRELGLNHFAVLQVGELGYMFDRTWSPHLLFQYQYASGDRDPTDNRKDTFNLLFGARRFESGPTGIWGPFFRSNTQSPGYRLILSPTGSLELTLAHRMWWLAQARDQWVGSGLSDPSGNSGNFLGQHVEGWLTWKANAILSFDIGYAYLAKGPYLSRVPLSPPDHNAHYFYVAPTVRF